MTALFSITSGLVLIPEGTNEYAVWSARTDEVVGLESALHEVSLARDWVEIENTDNGLLCAKHKSNAQFALTLFSVAVDLIGEPESHLALEKIEGLIPEKMPLEVLRDYLLISPFSDLNKIERLNASANKIRLPAITGLITELLSLQPAIRRLADAWIDISPSLFAAAGISKSDFWKELRDGGYIYSLVTNNTKANYEAVFFKFMTTTTPKFVSGINKIKNIVVENIFGKNEAISWVQSDFEDEDVSVEASELVDDARPDHSVFLRINKQKEKIISELLEGNDANADKYLDDLIDFQQRRSEQIELVKTLCDLGKKAEDNYRYDFEEKCLQKAYKLDSSEPFVNFQLGNYFKRVGDYASAISFLEKSHKLGVDETQALSAIAGVYSFQGLYDRAIESFCAIAEGDKDPSVQVGIGDALRKKGLYQEALKKYSHVESVMGISDRTRAGIAQLFRSKGELKKSEAIYNEILKMPLDDSSQVVHQTALAGILKQLGDFQSAYDIVSKVIKKSPFNIPAKNQMASILALLGKYSEAKAYIVDTEHPSGYLHWRSAYLRGLLEFRSGGAPASSLLNYEGRVDLDAEESNILILMEVVASFAEEKNQEAASMLNNFDAGDNAYLNKIKRVLDYHCAVLNDRTALKKRLGRKVAALAQQDSGFSGVKRMVNNGTVLDIAKMETDLVLRYAV